VAQATSLASVKPGVQIPVTPHERKNLKSNKKRHFMKIKILSKKIRTVAVYSFVICVE
jgi:hypothetical protein